MYEDRYSKNAWHGENANIEALQGVMERVPCFRFTARGRVRVTSLTELRYAISLECDVLVSLPIHLVN